jgi:putative hemolysin
MFKKMRASLVRLTLMKLLRLSEVNAIYSDLPDALDAASFARAALDNMNVAIQVSDEDIARIPSSGPVVIVANHPFGAVEGLLLMRVLKERRPDAKILANHLLRNTPEMAESLIFVDPFGGPDATSRNLGPIRESVKLLRSGGALGVFPSGEVSHYRFGRGVGDPAWSPVIARILRKTGAPALPVYFHGANGLLFQLMGLIHPRLRTALLPHEFLKKRGQTIRMRIGSLIPPSAMASYQNDEDLTLFLRLRTYNLKHAALREEREARRARPIQSAPRVPVARAEPRQDLEAELAKLPASRTLVRSGAFKTVWARSSETPALLREIGRLRELSFREVGEGTGEAYDLDPFDEYYVHLALWNEERGELVGAYRLGLSDEIRPRFGKKGMYSCTLFNYKKAFLSSIEPSVELGRSFVRPEYQRHAQALPMLWKGLARFVAKHPQYRYLFGPVSITNEYETISRQYMIEFLQRNNLHEELSRYVKPKTPPRFRPLRKALDRGSSIGVLKNIDEVSALVADVEKSGRGVPVLLRQYLRLGGELLAFNVDHAFGDCLDGLILVDLLRTDPKILVKYMGKEEIAGYHAYHGKELNLESPSQPCNVKAPSHA